MSKQQESTIEPKRGNDGANILGPRNPSREAQDPDVVVPPATDSGTLPNMKWSFADSHMRIEEGGWARQTTVRELPTSIELAGVNMRLEAGVIRELHWHNEAEWAYMLEGEARISVLDVEGGIYYDDLKKGDLWYFPTGNPHSIQGLGKNGCEFLLIFDDGNFSEDETFLLSDWLAHTTPEVLAKNFQVPVEVFKSIPEKEKYIFPGHIPGELPENKGPYASRRRFTHQMLAQKPIKIPGGEVRIQDSKNFPVSTTVAAAHVILEPHALREMHWHPNADEWSFFIRGKARVTVFASGGRARTFNYVPGDVGIVPKNHGHFVENIGDEPLEMLEIFRAPLFQDFSLNQWLAHTDSTMVADHLNLKGKNVETFLASLSKEKVPIKPDDE